MVRTARKGRARGQAVARDAQKDSTRVVLLALGEEKESCLFNLKRYCKTTSLSRGGCLGA